MKYRIIKSIGDESMSSNITKRESVIFASHEINK